MAVYRAFVDFDIPTIISICLIVAPLVIGLIVRGKVDE